MTGRDYEYAAAHYLRWHGWRKVRVTQTSGDYGVDVLAERHGVRYAVQCKYYTHPVGIKAVQEAAAGKAQYGCERSMVVTNAEFTKAAQKLADSNDVLLLPGVGPHVPLTRRFPWLRWAAGLLWLTAICFAGWRAWDICGFPKMWPPLPVWHTFAGVLLLPALLGFLSMLLRCTLWRLQAARERGRTRRMQSRGDELQADLKHCRAQADALSKRPLPAGCFIRGRGGVSMKKLTAAYPESSLVRRLGKGLGHRRSFRAESIAKELRISRADAAWLAGCLVQSGHLICTRKQRYAWSAASCWYQ